MSRDTQHAAQILDDLLTKIDIIGPLRLDYEGPTNGVIEDRFFWELQITPRLETDLYEIAVSVRWPTSKNSKTGEFRQAEAYTLLNDPPQSRNPVLEWDDL